MYHFDALCVNRITVGVMLEYCVGVNWLVGWLVERMTERGRMIYPNGSFFL
jgi:hypothetical protein